MMLCNGTDDSIIALALTAFLIGHCNSQPLQVSLSLACYICCIYKASSKNLMPCIDILAAMQGQSATAGAAMDTEQFYIEQRDNFACFISEFRAKLIHIVAHMSDQPSSTLGAHTKSITY